MPKHNETLTDSETEDLPVDIGKNLRRAREAEGLSIQSVASSLRLTPKVIIALEENDFSDYQPVFVKGYLRNYGRLLNLPVEPLLESYNRSQQAEPKPAQAGGLGMASSARPSVAGYVLGFAGVVAVAAWLAGKLLSDGAEPPPTAALPPPTEEPRLPASPNPDSPVPATAPANAPAAELGAPATPHSGGSPMPAATSLQADKPMTAESSPAGDKLTVKLSATAWVGIRDGSGRSLVRQKLPAGSERSFTGQPPFFVVLGNEPSTQLELNGKPLTLPKGKGGVSRFNVEQNGEMSVLSGAPSGNPAKSKDSKKTDNAKAR